MACYLSARLVYPEFPGTGAHTCSDLQAVWSLCRSLNITDSVDIESEQTLGDGEGQGSLAFCSPGGLRVRHHWATQQQQLETLVLADGSLPSFTTHGFKLLLPFSKKSNPPSKVKNLPLLRLWGGKYCEIWSNFPRRACQLFWVTTAEMKQVHTPCAAPPPHLPQGPLKEPISGDFQSFCRQHDRVTQVSSFRYEVSAYWNILNNREQWVIRQRTPDVVK